VKDANGRVLTERNECREENASLKVRSNHESEDSRQGWSQHHKRHGRIRIEDTDSIKTSWIAKAATEFLRSGRIACDKWFIEMYKVC